jgi:hypothetical protein
MYNGQINEFENVEINVPPMPITQYNPVNPSTTLAEGISFSLGRSRSLRGARHLCDLRIFECHMFAQKRAHLGGVCSKCDSGTGMSHIVRTSFFTVEGVTSPMAMRGYNGISSESAVSCPTNISMLGEDGSLL